MPANEINEFLIRFVESIKRGPPRFLSLVFSATRGIAGFNASSLKHSRRIGDAFNEHHHPANLLDSRILTQISIRG